MNRRRPLLAALGVMALAGCGGGQAEPLFCPRVEAVAGLDRLNITYAEGAAPVATRLDVVDVACLVDNDDLLVGSVVSIRLAPDRPPGEVRVPYTLVIDTPEGATGSRADVAVLPPGASGSFEYFEHRFEGIAARNDVAVRLLYALVPDAAEAERIARERPRPATP